MAVGQEPGWYADPWQQASHRWWNGQQWTSDVRTQPAAGPATPPPIVASAQVRPDAPYRELSAAGIAYLLATALAMSGLDTGGGAGQEPTALLDLAMISLVGDVSRLMGVNRPLVRDGLRRLREAPRIGLQALCEAARIVPATLSSV